MFTAIESEYLISLVNVYKELGYKYYICHTVTETNNNYDMCFYFSKTEIVAYSGNQFSVTNGIRIYVDSSQRNDTNNNSVHSRDVLNSYSGVLNINQAEFIYTNATVSYNIALIEINPDICKSGNMNYENTFLSYVIIFTLLIMFLYTFVCNIIRLRRT